ncbi:MAG TPA: ATP-binding protein, partial [Bdellovibrio sp.]|nr:ATP-binding protein [Bdellovibrio sp.]
SKSIKLKFNINNESSEDRKMILGDNDLLGNLIFNIIENAIKYSPNNEVVTITLLYKDETSELMVDDKGPGIPADVLPYIFERFSRGAEVETRVKGFGLGLAIAQKIAILHSAKLSAENLSGSGARFIFEIKNI